MAEESSKMATAKTVLSTVASVAATAMVARTVIRDYLPYELQDYMFMGMRKFFYRFSNELTMVIEEFDGLVNNEIYEAAECYLGNKITPSTRRLKISKPEKEKNFNITMEKDEKIIDFYNGEKLKWVWIVNKIQSTSGLSFYNPRDMNSTLRSEVRSFELTFHKKNKDMVINSYLPHIIREAKSMKREKKTLKIHAVDPDQMYDMKNAWTSMNLDHPATFDTLAMDSDQKDVIMKDLEMFVERRDYYRQVGRAWKRGYLLYGPPGTGKSSLIAAMANFLNFDIYDLELTVIRRNTELRKLLLATANKSILVVEDIDCTIDFQDRKTKRSRRRLRDMAFFDEDQNKVTLSGFLNFIDGLWSSSGDERIIIFTTNHKERLDPALLRPGRMDLHIHMSYCTPSGFRILASNYLGLKDHSLFKDIEDLLRTTNVTPAEVAEQLLKQNEPGSSLQSLIEFIDESKRKKETEEKEEDEEDEEEETQLQQEEVGNRDEQAEVNVKVKQVNAKLNKKGGGGELVQEMKELIPVEVAKNLGKILVGLIKDLVEMQTNGNGEIKVKEVENSDENKSNSC